jgi:hypothetical protein
MIVRGELDSAGSRQDPMARVSLNTVKNFRKRVCSRGSSNSDAATSDICGESFIACVRTVGLQEDPWRAFIREVLKLRVLSPE